MNILFVCTGNTCRSAMAEALLKKMLQEKGLSHVTVKSCGVGASPQFTVPPVVKQLMAEEGINISQHRPQRLDEEIVSKADLILVMEKYHYDTLIDSFPEAESKTFLLKEFTNEHLKGNNELNIYDPIGQSPEVYRYCKEEIKKCLEKLITTIQTDKKPM